MTAQLSVHLPLILGVNCDTGITLGQFSLVGALLHRLAARRAIRFRSRKPAIERRQTRKDMNGTELFGSSPVGVCPGSDEPAKTNGRTPCETF